MQIKKLSRMRLKLSERNYLYLNNNKIENRMKKERKVEIKKYIPENRMEMWISKKVKEKTVKEKIGRATIECTIETDLKAMTPNVRLQN